jgi:DinB superfamily
MPLTTSILGRLKTQHETLLELVKGLSEEQLRHRVNPEKWSAFEQIAHLVAYQPTFLARLQLIAHKETPVFERYLADNDPLFHQCLGYSLKELLEDLSTQRFLINNQITQLSETTLRREGVHPLYGRFTISQWAEFFLLHEAHHLFAIFMLTSAVKNSVQQ